MSAFFRIDPGSRRSWRTLQSPRVEKADEAYGDGRDAGEAEEPSPFSLSLSLSAGMSSREDRADVWGGGAGAVHQVPRDLPQPAHPAGARGPAQDLWSVAVRLLSTTLPVSLCLGISVEVNVLLVCRIMLTFDGLSTIPLPLPLPLSLTLSLWCTHFCSCHLACSLGFVCGYLQQPATSDWRGVKLKSAVSVTVRKTSALRRAGRSPWLAICSHRGASPQSLPDSNQGSPQPWKLSLLQLSLGSSQHYKHVSSLACKPSFLSIHSSLYGSIVVPSKSIGRARPIPLFLQCSWGEIKRWTRVQNFWFYFLVFSASLFPHFVMLQPYSKMD